MDTHHSPWLHSFDGSSFNGSDISALIPATPHATEDVLPMFSPSASVLGREGLPSDTSPKHPRFYFLDGSVTLQVQEVTYRVHGSVLALHPEHWARYNPELARTTGDTVTLHSVSTAEMDAFLSILYPTSFSRSRGPPLATKNDWSAVLRLSTMWSCKDMRSFAIEQLSDLAPPLEKLVLGLAYDVPEWRVPSYVALCLRPQMLSESEAERLTVRDVIRITAAREAIREGRVAATKDALTLYVTHHVCADSRGAKISAPVRVPEPPQPEHTAPSVYTLPLPAAIETPYSADERSRIAAQLSQNKYVDALYNITPSQITPFCSILKESWGRRVTEFPVRDLLRAILFRGSISPGPAFVPTGIQLLRAISILIRTGPFDSTEFPAPKFVELLLSRDIRALQDTWNTHETSRARLCTLNSYQKAHHAGYDDAFSSAALSIYPRGAREDWEL